jgi:hypothetical protein
VAAIAASLATVAVIAVGAVVLLHGRSGGTAPTPAGSYAQPAPAAQAAAWARLLSCARPPSGLPKGLVQAPIVNGAAPNPRLVDALGVLRSPWTAADAAPTVKCLSGPPLFVAGRVDARYVRYVGPGPRGGTIFLVPAAFVPTLLPHDARHGVPRGSWLTLACLFTVGGSPPGVDGCTPLPQIERPVGALIAAIAPPRIPLSIARRLCALHTSGAARARCISANRRVHVPVPPPHLVSGVVRDGIATLDVYAHTRQGERLVLTGVPIHANVYAFESGGAGTGTLTLVFKDGAGRAVPTMPVHIAVGAATGKVVTGSP